MPTTPARLWSRVANVYDLQLVLERPALNAALDLADPRAVDALLDVGTGTGGVLRELSRRPSPPRRAVGVDSSPEMLRAAEPLPSGWTLVEADARDLPFDEDSFDVVTTAYLLHVLDRGDRTGALEEIARVLRPAGRLVAVTPALPRARIGRAFLRPVAAMAERSSGLASGLRALDPREEIGRHLRVRRTRWVNRGYPSICVLAGAPDLSRSGRGPETRPAPTG